MSRHTNHIIRFARKSGALLTSKERKELDALALMPDEKIDTSDIPEIPMEVWRKFGEVGKFYRPIKERVTMRIDRDVLQWLKAEGRGYQTKANRLLRQQMIAESRRRLRGRRPDSPTTVTRRAKKR